MQDRAASGEMTMTIDVAQFLMEWVKHHIIASDRRIGNYMTTGATHHEAEIPSDKTAAQDSMTNARRKPGRTRRAPAAV